MTRIPVATELGRHDRFWPAVAISIAVHATFIAAAVKASSLPRIELDQVPLQARLVRLGEKKPEQILPQKETPPEPAPAATAPPAPVPPPATPPPPSPTPTPAAAASPTKTPPRPSPAKSPANGAGITDALAKMEKQVQREKWGDPNGDPEGDSEEGSEGDRYAALIFRALRANYQVPSTIPDKERLYLEAPVTIWIEPDGTISRWKINRSSGNSAFDAALERTIRAARLPPPPAAEREHDRTKGVPLVFNLK